MSNMSDPLISHSAPIALISPISAVEGRILSEI